MENEIKIVNNEAKLRFETKAGSDFAYTDYRWHKGDLALMHTFVPESARGKGVATALAKYALEYAKEKKLTIMVYCPFVARYMKEHPEYNILLDKQYYSK